MCYQGKVAFSVWIVSGSAFKLIETGRNQDRERAEMIEKDLQRMMTVEPKEIDREPRGSF